MATFSSVTPQHILQAIAEYDDRGGDAFLGLYGFGPSTGYWLVHEGRRYDSKAVLGVAHKYATGRVAPAEEFRGGEHGAAEVLRKHGFVVDGPPTPAGAQRTSRSAPRSSARTAHQPAARRTPAVEREAAICPTCFTALPATGVCDFCG